MFKSGQNDKINFESYSQHSLLFTYIWKMHFSVLSGLEKIYSLSANWFITPFKGSHDFELLGNYLSAAKYQQYTRSTVATSFTSAILQLVFTAIKMNIILDPYAESQLSLVWRHFSPTGTCCFAQQIHTVGITQF